MPSIATPLCLRCNVTLMQQTTRKMISEEAIQQLPEVDWRARADNHIVLHNMWMRAVLSVTAPVRNGNRRASRNHPRQTRPLTYTRSHKAFRKCHSYQQQRPKETRQRKGRQHFSRSASRLSAQKLVPNKREGDPARRRNTDLERFVHKRDTHKKGTGESV